MLPEPLRETNFITNFIYLLFRSSEMIRCLVPPFSKLQEEWLGTTPYPPSTNLEVPLSLVRDDGVIYSTGTSFTYTTGAVSDAFAVPIPPSNPSNIPSQLALPTQMRQLLNNVGGLNPSHNAGRFVPTGYPV